MAGANEKPLDYYTLGYESSLVLMKCETEWNCVVPYTVMRKREAGYNPAVGDWEFLGGDGKQLQASGRLENCQACHVAKKDSDFVFRAHVKLEQLTRRRSRRNL